MRSMRHCSGSEQLCVLAFHLKKLDYVRHQYIVEIWRKYLALG
jgi:hypothetical protein